VVDAEGRVVGITTLRLRDGFALAQPAGPDLRRRIDELAAGRQPRRRVLGVGIAPGRVAQRPRAPVRPPQRPGALVRAVAEGGPAARAGIRTGDLVTAVGDVAVGGPADLEAALADPELPASVRVHLVRGADELDVVVTFDDEPGPADATDEPAG